MSAQHFDPIMRDRHPWTQCVVGQSQSGKSTYVNRCLQLWGELGRRSLSIDAVCPRVPQEKGKHIAGWATGWCLPDELRHGGTIPPSVSLLALDEAALCFTPARSEFVAVRNAVMRGQHHGLNGISTILATQRATQLHRDAWDNCKRWVIFHTTGSLDLERIADLPHMTAAALEQIPYLPVGYAVISDEKEGLFLADVAQWRAEGA